MLKREIAAHQQVNDSVYVVKLVDSSIIYAGSSAVEGLLLLPFYPGGTVQDLIDKHQKIPLKRILSITADICRGLIAFHTKNLSFRDLKPANCLIDGAGRAVLMDLGSVSTARLAINSRKEALALQELCAESCTAPFRAPELFDPPSDSVINETCDIWFPWVLTLGLWAAPFMLLDTGKARLMVVQQLLLEGEYCFQLHQIRTGLGLGILYKECLLLTIRLDQRRSRCYIKQSFISTL